LTSEQQSASIDRNVDVFRLIQTHGLTDVKISRALDDQFYKICSQLFAESYNHWMIKFRSGDDIMQPLGKSVKGHDNIAKFGIFAAIRNKKQNVMRTQLIPFIKNSLIACRGDYLDNTGKEPDKILFCITLIIYLQQSKSQ
jgi:hypothetical protein